MTTTSTVICETCKLAHGPAEDCQKAQAQAMIDLLYNIGDEVRCGGCGAPMFWVKHKNGRNTPYTPQGLNHFIDCPVAERYRKPKPAQGGLF